MKLASIARACAAVATLSVVAAAQTGTPDQTSPFGGPFSTAQFDTSLPTNQWQAQVKVGLAGPLEGFLLSLDGPAGAQVTARVRIGPGWNTGLVAFQAQVTKATSGVEILFVDATSANLSFIVGNRFVIELQGNGSGAKAMGTYVAPGMGSPLYPEPLFRNGPGCFSDCGGRIGFQTYIVTPPLPPSVYCTGGTTTNGCVASISASANPRVTYSTPCQVNIASVEGLRTGIVFYGLTQLIQPWCSSGGTSFLCVKPPTMRTGVQSSGGTFNACDGTLAIDWNAFQLAHPAALGAPWLAGEKAFVQGWFRDPASCKTTSLSDALELIYLP